MRLIFGVWMVFPPFGSISPQPRSSHRTMMKLGLRRFSAIASVLTVKAATVAAVALRNCRRFILRPLSKRSCPQIPNCRLDRRLNNPAYKKCESYGAGVSVNYRMNSAAYIQFFGAVKKGGISVVLQ